MALSEIEKLERRYADNPTGLTFAPLAEVHRKNGDVVRALELLRSGLELHPNYTPASIVLGRCHLDLGDLPAAESAFAHVLELDGENVIALKALADISERQHHFDQAEQRLRSLLAVDRSNDEARAQLERIEQARRDTAAAPPPPERAPEPVLAASPEPPASADVAASPTDEPPAEPSLMVPVVEPSAAWSATPEPGPAETIEPAPLSLAGLESEITLEERPEPPPEGLEFEESTIETEEIEPIAGLVGRDVDEAMPDETGFRVEVSEDIVLRSSGGSEFQVPDASLELSERVRQPEASPFGDEPAPGLAGTEAPTAPEPPAIRSEPEEPAPSWASAEYRSRVWEPPAAEPVPAALEAVAEPHRQVELPPPAEPVVEPESVAQPVEAREQPVGVAPEPELVVTETMAEVLLQQGHEAEALRVYRELEVRNGGDTRLLAKIAELEEGRQPEPEAAPPKRSYAAADTGGQSVGDFFRGLLAARPPLAPVAPAARVAAAPAPAAGAPTRPAPDALSLSSVFGEEATLLPPAVPAPGAPPTGGVSFDEFYGQPGAASAGQKARAPDPKSDDLDQFHAWLQNLKR